MEISYNSSNPFNFVFAAQQMDENSVEEILTNPYDPYFDPTLQFFGLIFQHLKNVRFQLAKGNEVFRRLVSVVGLNKVNKIARSDDNFLKNWALQLGGLSTLVWAMVGFSLLVVTGLVTYCSFENEKNRREKPLNSWMKCAFIYAADILNNCVAGVVRSGPGRHVRSWWLLGVVFLMQFWSAGMKSDIILDNASFIDSLEDLLSKPELVCLVSIHGVDPFYLEEDDPRYEGVETMKRYVENVRDEKSIEVLLDGSGVAMVQEQNVALPHYQLFEKLTKTNRKQYVGKKKYNEGYTYTLFNKRLPRAIKEDIDYIIARLFETQQREMNTRRYKFESRDFIFDPKGNSATMSWSPKSFEFMSPVFRLWIIGMSLASVAFSVEFYLLRRRRIKVSPHHSNEIQIKA